MQKVLILDGNERSALAVVRSLGEKDIPVVVADETIKTLAGSSKYCQENFVYPSPYEYPEKFITTLKKESFQRNIKVMFPMTEITTSLVLKHREEFIGIKIPFANFEIFDSLTDKWRLFKLAVELGLSVPATYFVKSTEDLSTLEGKLEYPIVVKPYRSRILSDGKWIRTSVEYAHSIAELEDTIGRTEYLNRYPFLIQEYIKGEGRGIFTLYDQGKPVTFFAHRRIREKPPSGGVSVLSESIEVDSGLRQISQRIMDHVKWHGAAMTEFKVASDGSPYLMEVNARFWGSLQLSIDAGVDFPWLLYQVATGKDPDPVDSYKIGIRSRWLLGDLDHFYLKVKKQFSAPPENWRFILQFFKFFERNTRYEVNRWDDLRPFLFELKRYFRNRD